MQEKLLEDRMVLEVLVAPVVAREAREKSFKFKSGKCDQGNDYDLNGGRRN